MQLPTTPPQNVRVVSVYSHKKNRSKKNQTSNQLYLRRYGELCAILSRAVRATKLALPVAGQVRGFSPWRAAIEPGSNGERCKDSYKTRA